MNANNMDWAPQTFLSFAGRRIVRAVCGANGDWQVEPALTGLAVTTIAADPTDSRTLYAGTQTDGIYRSTDQGQTWQPWGLAGQAVKSIAASPHARDTLYAGVKPAALFKSIDGGRNWSELTSFRHIPNHWWWFSPAEAPFRAYVNAIAISPTDPDVVLAGIEFGAVVRSADGGRTWSGHRRGAIRDCHALRFHSGVGRWAYEAGGTGGGAAVSRDGGQTWNQPRGGLAKHYGVACAADPLQPEVWYVALAPSPGKAYGRSPEAYLYRASGGADWQPIGWESHPMSEFPQALATVPGAAGHLYAGTTHGHIWHSSDYGDTWRKLPVHMGRIGSSLLVW